MRPLTEAEVDDRVARGLRNQVEATTSRSVRDIVRANVLTRFNAILGLLFVAVLVVGAPGDALFGAVMVANSLIGIGQEVRAKRTLDRLAVLVAPQAAVRRAEGERVLPVSDIVLDDLVRLRRGDQVPVDGTVVETEGLEVDESLLTGEADPVPKQAGDRVLSASIVVAGAGTFVATAVGAQTYAHRLAAETKRFRPARSELVDGINRLLGYLSWVLVIVGPVLLVSQLARSDEGDTGDAVVSTVAALVGMVPEGLVLLTSLAFLVGALTLARRQVLVQELPAVEGLARVDVVCLDKTGTLTEGRIVFDRLVPVGKHGTADVAAAIGALVDDPHANPTARALSAAFAPPTPAWARTGSVAFASDRKWSAASFDGQGTWVLGAPEMVLPTGADEAVRSTVNAAAAEGQRVLVLARTGTPLDGERLPAGLAPLALLVFSEKVRADAPDTVRYFAAQEVELKILSGDNPITVGAVARRVGLPGGRDPVDARTLPEDQTALGAALEAHAVFGRFTPQQKRRAVAALQAREHTVAMTGDGVNDALALKDADIGVAMGDGAPATRAVAQLVLLDNRFAHLPTVVNEGRRVIANIERVASLFVVKNVYSGLLALVVVGAGVPYPFLPRQLTLLSGLTIGIPAFVLSFAPSQQRYTPGFLRRVLRFSLPTGAVVALAIFAAYVLARERDYAGDQARAAATAVAMITGLCVLVLVSRPLHAWKLGLIAAMAALFVAAVTVPWAQRFFHVDLPAELAVEATVIGLVASAVIVVLAPEKGPWAVARRGRASVL